MLVPAEGGQTIGADLEVPDERVQEQSPWVTVVSCAALSATMTCSVVAICSSKSRPASRSPALMVSATINSISVKPRAAHGATAWDYVCSVINGHPRIHIRLDLRTIEPRVQQRLCRAAIPNGYRIDRRRGTLDLYEPGSFLAHAKMAI